MHTISAYSGIMPKRCNLILRINVRITYALFRLISATLYGANLYLGNHRQECNWPKVKAKRFTMLISDISSTPSVSPWEINAGALCFVLALFNTAAAGPVWSEKNPQMSIKVA